MSTGKKRGSPGAEDEKSPLQEVKLNDEDAQKLQNIQRDITRAELVSERLAQERLLPIYERRRAVSKEIPTFWGIALMNHQMLAVQLQHQTDQTALSYLEDVWVERDTKEPRCFTIEFHFKENPFFLDKVLKKSFTYVPPPAAANEVGDEDGITESMLDFSWDRDVEHSTMKIQWKSESKNLTKLYPRLLDDDELTDETPGDAGSFFNFFERNTDPYEVGPIIGNEIFPRAVEFFLGTASEWDSDEEDEEDEDDEAEIDLEQPRTKKQKKV